MDKCECGGEFETITTALGPCAVCERCGEPKPKEEDE
jgi:hypothetical protein